MLSAASSNIHAKFQVCIFNVTITVFQITGHIISKLKTNKSLSCELSYRIKTDLSHLKYNRCVISPNNIFNGVLVCDSSVTLFFFLPLTTGSV